MVEIPYVSNGSFVGLEHNAFDNDEWFVGVVSLFNDENNGVMVSFTHTGNWVSPLFIMVLV